MQGKFMFYLVKKISTMKIILMFKVLMGLMGLTIP